MIYWFLGIPGSGKTHIARLFSQMTGIPQYEGDDFHTEEDRRAVAEGMFTLEHRHAQLSRIGTALQSVRQRDALVTHPLPDKASRARVRDSGDGNVRLAYVRAPLDVTRERLSLRTNHHFGAHLLDAWLVRHWQEPEGEDCFVIENDSSAQTLETRLKELRSI